jgi:hypothetical protein
VNLLNIERLRTLNWPWVVFIMFVYSNLLTGPVRWIFAISGLAPLIYLPIMLIGVCSFAVIVQDARQDRMTRTYFIALLYTACAFVCGLLNVGSLVQVGFGFYVLWPFFFGVLFGPMLIASIRNASKGALAVWLIACVGVIVNSTVTYPWEGFEYSVGGMDVESSREWYSGGGNKRLGGLARASFDAAIQIALASCLAVCTYKNILAKLLIAGISLLAIYFTDAKGMILSFVAMFSLSFMNDAWLDSLKVWVFSALMILGMGLPIVSWFLQYKFDITGIAANPLLFSFTDRIENMWPEALALMHEHGTVMLGRGFGGIGVAQTYFESHMFNAADNIYVYLSAVFGLLMFPFSAMALLRFMHRRDPNRFIERFTYLLLVTVMVYGLTANVLENAPMALVLGMLIRHGLQPAKPQEITA